MAVSGILIAGHGTRDETGREQFFTLVDRITARVDVPVRAGFLELAQPDLKTAIAELVACGVEEIRVLPVMLFAAGHVLEDIPAAVRSALREVQAEHVSVRIGRALETQPALIELSVRRFREALAGGDRVPTFGSARGDSGSWRAEETALVFVGRGNRNLDAQRRFTEFAERHCAISQPRRLIPCYLAMASPRLEDVIDGVLSQASRIVIQPHLLFEGALARRLSTIAAEAVRRCGGRMVACRVAPVLGPDELTAEAMLGGNCCLF
ncbi:sirohydrochlorin chelatase [Thermostilla marina]